MVLKWFQKKAKRLFGSVTGERALVHVDDDGFMSDDISVSMEDILSAENSDDLGKVHILSLTEFKTALGKLWEKRRGTIYILTEAVLREKVGDGNKWENPTPKIYMMLFPTLSEAEADARAFEIAEEVGLKIIGDRFDGSKRPHIRVAGVDPKDILNEDGTFDLEKIEAAGDNGVPAGQDDEPLEETAKSKQKRSVSSEEKTQKKPLSSPEEHAQAEDDSPNWKKKKHTSHDPGTKDWEKNNRGSLENEEADWHKNQHDDTGEVNTNWVKMKSRKDAGDLVGFEDDYTPSLRFYPCWQKQTQALQIYRATLYVEKNAEYLTHGLEAYGAWRGTQTLLEKDIWMLQHSARALFEHTRKQILTPVFVPAHVTSLIGQNLKYYLNAYARLNDVLRTDYIIIEALATTGFALESLIDAAQAIQTQNGRIALLAEPGHFEKIPVDLALDFAGIDLSQYTKEKALSHETLQTVAQALRDIDVPFYVFGISKRSQLGETLDLGASLINGPALVRMTDKLRPPFDLPEERLRPK